MAGSERRRRAQRGEAEAVADDPTRAATRRNGNPTTRLSQLALKYTEPRPDPAEVDQVIDSWRRQGWTK